MKFNITTLTVLLWLIISVVSISVTVTLLSMYNITAGETLFMVVFDALALLDFYTLYSYYKSEEKTELVEIMHYKWI